MRERLKYFLFIEFFLTSDCYYLVKARTKQHAVKYMKKKVKISDSTYRDYFLCIELPIPTRRKFIELGFTDEIAEEEM